jgi:hypothetical protein
MGTPLSRPILICALSPRYVSSAAGCPVGRIGNGKRRCGQEQFSVEAARCRQGDPIWKRGLGLSLVQDHAGLAQPTSLI